VAGTNSATIPAGSSASGMPFMTAANVLVNCVVPA
jgi:hypothetical protein